MPTKMNELGIDRMSIRQRLDLMSQIWDSITAEKPGRLLTDLQREDLRGRIAQDDESPDDLVPGDEVWASVMRRAGQ